MKQTMSLSGGPLDGMKVADVEEEERGTRTVDGVTEPLLGPPSHLLFSFADDQVLIYEYRGAGTYIFSHTKDRAKLGDDVQVRTAPGICAPGSLPRGADLGALPTQSDALGDDGRRTPPGPAVATDTTAGVTSPGDPGEVSD